MDYQTISNLLNKNILLMLADLHKNKVITAFSINSYSMYTYYFKNQLSREFSGIIPSINLNNKDTIKFRTYWNHDYTYNFEDMKTEEDIHAIVEILKQSLLDEIKGAYLQNTHMMLTDITREIQGIFYNNNQNKNINKNIYEESKKLVEIINTTILQNKYEFNNKVLDDSSANKKKIKIHL